MDSYYYKTANSTCVQPWKSVIYDVNIINAKLIIMKICVDIGIRNICIRCIVESRIFALRVYLIHIFLIPQYT